ncbi:GtrA family protein [Streptococcus hongkongensis]|nr:sugar translocase [Streptococcus uberis]
MVKIQNYREIINYLIFGVLTTFVYIITRWIIFTSTHQVLIAAFFANFIAILFAFITNDRIVFKQASKGKFSRFIKFVTLRLFALILDIVLAYLFVKQFPEIIGYFVNNDIATINLTETLFSQALIIILNYLLSKFLIFKNKIDT